MYGYIAKDPKGRTMLLDLSADEVWSRVINSQLGDVLLPSRGWRERVEYLQGKGWRVVRVELREVE